MSDRIGALLLILLGGVIAAWCIREYRRTQPEDTHSIEGSEEPIFEQLCAEWAKRESRNLDIELWLFQRNAR